jgi:hypothetical protein
VYQTDIKYLHIESEKLYLDYKSGLLNLQEYLELLKPLDKAIDKLEFRSLSHYLQGNLASEKSFLELSHL